MKFAYLYRLKHVKNVISYIKTIITIRMSSGLLLNLYIFNDRKNSLFRNK